MRRGATRPLHSTATSLIAGAGLVGLALAPALARGGLDGRARRPRAGRRAPIPNGDDDLGRARLRDQPRQRGVSARARRVAGAAAGAHQRRSRPCASTATAARRSSSRAYELGERALAWIVEERALRAALRAAARRAPASTIDRAARRSRRSRGRRTPATLRFDDGTHAVARGWSSPPTASRSWVRACRGHRARCRSPTARPPSSPISPASARTTVSRCQWFRADGGMLAWLPLPGRRISIVWSAPDALGAGIARRSTPRRSPRGWRTPARTRSASCECITPAAAFPLAFLQAPGGRRASRWRWSATPRTASIRSPGRASTWASATRRRWRPCCASAVRSQTPARRCCSNATRAGAPGPSRACRPSPTASCGCSALRAAAIGGCATCGMRAVDRLRPLRRATGAACAALDCAVS